jgi:hypothetical protein
MHLLQLRVGPKATAGKVDRTKLRMKFPQCNLSRSRVLHHDGGGRADGPQRPNRHTTVPIVGGHREVPPDVTDGVS